MANFITGHRDWGLQPSSAFYCSQPRQNAQIKCQIPEVTGLCGDYHALSANTFLTPITLISKRRHFDLPHFVASRNLFLPGIMLSSHIYISPYAYLPFQYKQVLNICTLITTAGRSVLVNLTNTDSKSVPRGVSQNTTGLLRGTFFWYNPKYKCTHTYVHWENTVTLNCWLWKHQWPSNPTPVVVNQLVMFLGFPKLLCNTFQVHAQTVTQDTSSLKGTKTI